MSASARDGWDRPRPGRAAWLGRLDWSTGLALQERVHARRVAGEVPDTLLLLEHESVYTLGRRTDPSHLLVPREELRATGHAVHETGRGGDVTWHGPGQLVTYPIVDLGDGRRDIHRYLRQLEEVLIRTCASLGVEAWRRDGLTGAWTAGGKVGAIGIRVVRWVTQHGTSLNVDCDLDALRAIVPCGLHGEPVTTLARETGRPLAVEEIARVQAAAFSEVFHVRWSPTPAPDLPPTARPISTEQEVAHVD